MPAANSSANSSCMSLSRAPLEKVVCQVTVASGPLFVVAWLIVARRSQQPVACSKRRPLDPPLRPWLQFRPPESQSEISAFSLSQRLPCTGLPLPC